MMVEKTNKQTNKLEIDKQNNNNNFLTSYSSVKNLYDIPPLGAYYIDIGPIHLYIQFIFYLHNIHNLQYKYTIIIFKWQYTM